MPWLGRLADACCGKVIWPTHATARRTAWNILRQGEPGRFCSEWVSNVAFDERVTIPYISDGVMTWCFDVGSFAVDVSFDWGALELPHSTPFLSKRMHAW